MSFNTGNPEEMNITFMPFLHTAPCGSMHFLNRSISFFIPLDKKKKCACFEFESASLHQSHHQRSAYDGRSLFCRPKGVIIVGARWGSNRSKEDAQSAAVAVPPLLRPLQRGLHCHGAASLLLKAFLFGRDLPVCVFSLGQYAEPTSC